MGFLFEYKVVVPDAVDQRGLAVLLTSLGSQEWELIDVEVQSNFLILRKKSLPAGCAPATWAAIQRLLQILRGDG